MSPYVDSSATGLMSAVFIGSGDTPMTLAGLCVQQAIGSRDLAANTALVMPRGIGDHALQWYYADGPVTPSLTVPGQVNSTLAIAPALPGPAGKRIMQFEAGNRLRDEQRDVAKWAASHGSWLVLGDCAQAVELARAIYGDQARSVTVSDTLPPMAFAPISDTLTLSGTMVITVAGALSPDAAAQVGPGQYVMAGLTSDSNCPGSYIMGRILNAQGGPVAGATVIMQDEWGNKFVAVSKSGESDYGGFDFPLGYASAVSLNITVLDEAGNPAGPTVTVRHLAPDDLSPCHHVILQRTTG